MRCTAAGSQRSRPAPTTAPHDHDHQRFQQTQQLFGGLVGLIVQRVRDAVHHRVQAAGFFPDLQRGGRACSQTRPRPAGPPRESRRCARPPKPAGTGPRSMRCGPYRTPPAANRAPARRRRTARPACGQSGRCRSCGTVPRQREPAGAGWSQRRREPRRVQGPGAPPAPAGAAAKTSQYQPARAAAHRANSSRVGQGSDSSPANSSANCGRTKPTSTPGHGHDQNGQDRRVEQAALHLPGGPVFFFVIGGHPQADFMQAAVALGAAHRGGQQRREGGRIVFHGRRKRRTLPQIFA